MSIVAPQNSFQLMSFANSPFRRWGRFVGSSLLLASLCFSGSAWAEEVAITDAARAHFRAGVNLMQDPDGARYGEAFVEFRRAYQDSPSWKILGNLGICAMKLERTGEAIEAFEKYLEEGGENLSPEEREQVQRDLETQRTSVTWLTVSSVPEGATLLDRRIPLAGSPVENRYSALAGPRRIGVRNGRHEMTVRLEGHEPVTWSFEANGGEVEHVFELKEDAAPVSEQPAAASAQPVVTESTVLERPTPTGVYVGAGLTGAFAVAATVTGILALDKNSKYDEANGSDEEAASKYKKSGQALNVTTDILIGSALVAAGTTAYLYFTRPSVEVQASEGATRDEQQFALAPVVLRGGGGLWFQGEF